MGSRARKRREKSRIKGIQRKQEERAREGHAAAQQEVTGGRRGYSVFAFMSPVLALVALLLAYVFLLSWTEDHGSPSTAVARELWITSGKWSLAFLASSFVAGQIGERTRR